MKKTVRNTLLALGILAAAALSGSAQAIGLRLPAQQFNLIYNGMGGAVGADGTFFNAASYNPALLSQAPFGVEAFSLGFNISNDTFGVIDYVQNINFQADTAFKNLSEGLFTNNSAEITDGLSSIQDVVNHLADKAVQAGAGLNVAVKVTPNLGIQIYNSTHGLLELQQGTLTQILDSIPLPYNSSTSGAEVNSAVAVLRNDLQAGIDATLTSAQQSSVSGDIAALKNGTEDLPTFVAHVKVAVPTVDEDAFKRELIDKLINDLAILSTLVYSDTVFMGSYSFDPWKDLPLTAGMNLKIVNRHIAYAAISTSENSGVLNNLGDDIKQSTTRWGADFGFLYKVKEIQTDFGLSLLDLFHAGASLNASSGSQLAGVVTDPAPTIVRLGASWHMVPDLRVNLDIDDIFGDTSFYDGSHSFGRFKFGAGYKALGFLTLRAGFGNDHLAGGIGVLAGFFGLDYTYAADDLSQSFNHYAQMRLVF